MFALQRGLLLALLVASLTACGSLLISGQTHGGRPAGTGTAAIQRDAAISAAIGRLYVRETQISAFDVEVDTIDGVVSLTGRVRDRNAAQRAIELARSVDGVRRVESHLSVIPR